MKTTLALLAALITTAFADYGDGYKDYYAFAPAPEYKTVPTYDYTYEEPVDPPSVAYYTYGNQKEQIQFFEIPTDVEGRISVKEKIDNWLAEGHKFIGDRLPIGHPDGSITLIYHYIEAVPVEEGQGAPIQKVEIVDPRKDQLNQEAANAEAFFSYLKYAFFCVVSFLVGRASVGMLGRWRTIRSMSAT